MKASRKLVSMLRNHKNGVTTLLIAMGDDLRVSLIGPNNERPINDIDCEPSSAANRANELVQKFYSHDCVALRCEDWKEFATP